MVLFNANTFVLITLSLLLNFPAASWAQKSSTTSRSWLSQMRTLQRWGVQGITVPQRIQLRSSLGNVAEVLVAQSGLGASYDWEGRVGRWSLSGGLGVSLIGVSASSTSTDVAYNYSTSNKMNYMISLGSYYITESFVRVGVGLRSLYSDYSLSVPTVPGVSYDFNYGSPFKHYLSLELNWQIFTGMTLSQTLLHPLAGDYDAGWVLGLKKTF